MLNKSSLKGFTLIEFSIVLILIGLIIGGILIGQDILKSAQLRNVISTVEEHKMMLDTFELKYDAMAGDMANALDIWPECSGGASCGGNNDGKITSTGAGIDENLQAWHHLHLAGIADAPYTGLRVSSALVPGTNVPAIDMRGAGFLTTYQAPVSWYGESGQLFQLGAQSGNQIGGYFLTPEEAYIIDSKVDDGISRSGKIESRSGGGLPCVISGGILGPGWNYNVENDDVACDLIFFW